MCACVKEVKCFYLRLYGIGHIMVKDHSDSKRGKCVCVCLCLCVCAHASLTALCLKHMYYTVHQFCTRTTQSKTLANV